MNYRSDVASVARAIGNVRNALESLVIAQHKKLTFDGQDVDAETWSRLAYDLEEQLDRLSRTHEQVRQSLYNEGLEAIRKQGFGNEQPEVEIKHQIPPPQPSEREKEILDFVRRKGHAKGTVIASHFQIEESTFRKHYSKRLKQFGLKNDRDGSGYYVSDS